MRTLLILPLLLLVVALGAAPKVDLADGVEEKPLAVGRVSKRDPMSNKKQTAVFMINEDPVRRTQGGWRFQFSKWGGLVEFRLCWHFVFLASC